jgi:hypothetical protein
MKYIKYYEQIEDKPILNHNACWVIYGDADTILETHKKFIEYIRENLRLNITDSSSIEHKLKKEIPRNDPSFIVAGSYLFYNRDNYVPVGWAGNLAYWVFSNTNQQDAKEHIKKENCSLQGELKIVNNELILDPIEVIRDKYNV